MAICRLTPWVVVGRRGLRLRGQLVCCVSVGSAWAATSWDVAGDALVCVVERVLTLVVIVLLCLCVVCVALVGGG